MVSGIEGVGEAVTGGMIARAVEPEAGEAEGHFEETRCRNCGAELSGAYCAACGQKAHLHRTLGAFGHDLLHSVLHFEGKIWRTLPLLAWRPGELTRRYIHGERAKFVSPTALFLFSIFIMFAVFSLVGGPTGTLDRSLSSQTTQEILTEERDVARARLQRLEAQRAERARRGADTRVHDRLIREARDEAEGMEIARQTTERGLNISVSEQPARLGWLNAAWEKAKQNPDLLLYKLQTNAYKFSWALIPISLPLVWLLFLHRRRYRQEYGAYDHIVFITYSIAFMTLLVVALSLLQPIHGSADFSVLALIFIPPVHMFRQVKQAYRLRWWSALWRTAALLWFASVAATLYFVMLLTIGALG